MKPIYTMDFETDPFVHGKSPRPFCVGLYDGFRFISIWSKSCAKQIVDTLKKLPPGVIYMHNGGRFDIFFLYHWLDAEMRIINGRIVEARLGEHLLRDSYAMIPVPLSAYKKDDIDIEKLYRDVREIHRDEILSYLRGDCVYLYELVTAFRDEFGDYLTIGSAAMASLKKFHDFGEGSSYLDEKFRGDFFYGGRVQCFKSGIIKQPFHIYDVNSMYPYVMANFPHPGNADFDVDRIIDKNTFFVVVEGKQLGKYGAFPIRKPDGGITFTREQGTFFTTIHEFNAAIECGYFKPDRIIKTYGFKKQIVFDEFVNHFYSARMKAQTSGDGLHKLFYKLILNSASGKFSQNPDNFFDYAITHHQRMPEPWKEQIIHENGKYIIWRKHVKRQSYYNVAIGASITGAARSVLLRAIKSSIDAVYCDTDSITCRTLGDTKFSSTELGSWKLEGSGDKVVIAGKKLYAAFNGDTCIKHATKGSKLTPEEIIEVAKGETVTYRNHAPTFKLDGRTLFIKRNIKSTISKDSLTLHA